MLQTKEKAKNWIWIGCSILVLLFIAPLLVTLESTASLMDRILFVLLTVVLLYAILTQMFQLLFEYYSTLLDSARVLVGRKPWKKGILAAGTVLYLGAALGLVYGGASRYIPGLTLGLTILIPLLNEKLIIFAGEKNLYFGGLSIIRYNAEKKPVLGKSALHGRCHIIHRNNIEKYELDGLSESYKIVRIYLKDGYRLEVQIGTASTPPETVKARLESLVQELDRR